MKKLSGTCRGEKWSLEESALAHTEPFFVRESNIAPRVLFAPLEGEKLRLLLLFSRARGSFVRVIKDYWPGSAVRLRAVREARKERARTLPASGFICATPRALWLLHLKARDIYAFSCFYVYFRQLVSI